MIDHSFVDVHPKLSSIYIWMITKKILHKLVSFLMIGLGIHGSYEEMHNIFIVYPRLAGHLKKIYITTDVYDKLLRNSVYMAVAHLAIATLGISLMLIPTHNLKIFKFIAGSLIILIAYFATTNFNLPESAHSISEAILEGLVFSRH